MQRRSFVLGLFGALVAAPAMALPLADLSPAAPAAPAAGEPQVEQARWGRGWGRGGNPHPRGRARRVRRGWSRRRW